MTSGERYLGTEELRGLTAYDPAGEKVGKVEEVYVDDRTGRPDWITVTTGLFGMKMTFVPLEGARRDGEGLRLAHTKDTIKEAPRVDADQHLDADEEQRLYRHYGVSHSGMDAAGGVNTNADRSMADSGPKGGPAGLTGAVGTAGTGMANKGRSGMADTGRAGTAGARGGQHPDEMVRSEERLEVGKTEDVVGRARLRKVVVTENVVTTVPISHEEVRVVHEPIREGEGVRADIGEAEAEVTLHAERPVVRKEAVPVERVHLETEKVTEQQEVADTVRKEQIEYDDGTGKAGPAGRRGPGGRHGRPDQR
ncbi:DUF2382 domain-containing protein [Streptomyces minutiscleroticus]|uniref:Photosystem reaction center subunit H n=1 Tax=Streptomyces minutiscleroticus TaxID=68238 RepID=A0A918NHF8_9ACTN|nr:PRC and DUF2382 domain-containing protein [Streptomyces minutiscleroticus]GGX73389.1 photosystem reaction center subunit H [Streptomyces minutiscleroticus]